MECGVALRLPPHSILDAEFGCFSEVWLLDFDAFSQHGVNTAYAPGVATMQKYCLFPLALLAGIL